MLIAVAGLSGAGKTTTVEHLQVRGVGRIIYVGAYVKTEVLSRGLALTPENEQAVRNAVREELGRDVFARRAIADIQKESQSATILLDAIYLEEEGEAYRRELESRLIVLGIEASFEVRASRLAMRKERPLSAEQLLKRDQFEVDDFRLEEVVVGADYRLRNEGTIEAFKNDLDTLAAQWRL